MSTPLTESAALALVWKALANPVRRQILDILRDHPCCTGDLCEHFPELSRFAVMQHLKVLEQGQLLIHRKHGRQRFNYLNPVPIQQIYQRWVVHYQAHWAESLVALKTQLETAADPNHDGDHADPSTPA